VGLVLGVDTCGPSGSVALARLASDSLELLGQIELVGRSYSATLIAAVEELLSQSHARIEQLDAIVVTNGPGSFTGVRVGLAAVKGLAEPAQIPVAVVSRLAVLAAKACIAFAALDAHRHEIFLRIEMPGTGPRELLAGAAELTALLPPPTRIAVCDAGSAALLAAAWPATKLVQSASPTAADALALTAPLVRAGAFVDLALLDGHYLRRSDAEIFSAPVPGA